MSYLTFIKNCLAWPPYSHEKKYQDQQRGRFKRTCALVTHSGLEVITKEDANKLKIKALSARF